MFNSIEHSLMNLLGLGNHPAAPKATVDGMSARQLPGPVTKKQAQLDYLPAQQKMMVPGSQPAGRSLQVRPATGTQRDVINDDLQGAYAFDGPLATMQGYTQNDLSRGLQGGMVNYGYVPFQGGQNPQMGDYGIHQILNRY
jgi:hypothetical protein